MAEYKLYFLDRNGRICRRHELEAADDASAISAARLIDPHATCELWAGATKVALLPAGKPPVVLR